MKKSFYVSIGTISLILGLIGIILPILPTTPFLLLTSFCFARGSERFHNWFINTNIYKKHLNKFVQSRSMTLKTKTCILIPASIMLAFPLFILKPFPLKLLIILLYFYKYFYFIFKIKTVKEEEEFIK